MTEVTPLLRVDDLRTGFGSNMVLHGVSVDVQPGSIDAILGLNGAGKSVTMKAIAGVVPAWSGAVSVAGVDVTRQIPEKRVEAGMAHVTQGRGVFPDLSVEENLRLGAYVLRRRDKRRYAGVLADLYGRFPRLAERRAQPAGTLSGGERAMLALARALIAEPTLLLVDEPTAGLAPVIVGEFAESLRQVNRDHGVTILLVEQNVPFALKVAHRAHIMQRGKIVYSSDVATLDREAIVGYLGIGPLLSRNVNGAPTKKTTARKRTATKTVPKKPAAKKNAAKKRAARPAAAKKTTKKVAKKRPRGGS